MSLHQSAAIVPDDAALHAVTGHWGLRIDERLASDGARLLACVTSANGKSYVLKVGDPAGIDQEANLLMAAQGRGHARLERYDPERSALLLEPLGAPLSEMDLPYRDKVDIICGTLLDAWMPVPVDCGYTTGRDRANELATAILKLWQALPNPPAQGVLDTALRYCLDRASAYRPENAVVAHGAPLPENTYAVVERPFGEFRFINPQPVAAEPAYDLGLVMSGWNEGLDGQHAEDIARSYARHITSRTQVPAEAIWQWAYITWVHQGLLAAAYGNPERGRDMLLLARVLRPQD